MLEFLKAASVDSKQVQSANTKPKPNKAGFMQRASGQPSEQEEYIPKFGAQVVKEEGRKKPVPNGESSQASETPNNHGGKVSNLDVTREKAAILMEEGLDDNRNFGLLQKRALYNAKAKEGDKEGLNEVFADYLPRRQALVEAGDKNAVKQYDAQVEKVMEHLKKHGTEKESHVAVPFDTGVRKMDPSMRYMVASKIVDAWGSQPEMMNQVLSGKGKDPLKVMVTESSNATPIGDIGGVYSAGGKNSIQYRADSVTKSFANPTDGDDTIAHEFSHGVDHLDGKTDGLNSNFTPEQKQLMESERKRLSKDAAKENAKEQGLSDYAFSTPNHFSTVMMETFTENPGVVKKVSPKLYNMFRGYFDRPDLPPANGQTGNS